MWKFIVAGTLFTSTYGISTAAVKAPPKEFPKEAKLCIECHKRETTALRNNRVKVSITVPRWAATNAIRRIPKIPMPTFTMKTKSKSVSPILFHPNTAQTVTRRKWMNLMAHAIQKVDAFWVRWIIYWRRWSRVTTRSKQTVLNMVIPRQRIKNFYFQYDSLVKLYNEKYAKPAWNWLGTPSHFSNPLNSVTS